MLLPCRLLAACCLIAAVPVFAADEPAKPDGAFVFSGYLDVSYNNLSGNGFFTSGVANRVFDIEPDALRVRQLAFTLAKQPKEGFGGLLNVTLGKDADIIAAYNTDPNDGTGKGKRDKWDITQAFLQYATGSFTIIGGKYVTLAGAEVINSPSNANYSRSILFGYAIPFSHTGLRASYALSDTLTLFGGVNNGWDDAKDTNSAKTVELGLSYTPSKMFSMTAQGYSGKERVGGLVPSGPEGDRKLIDFVATLNATEQLSFVLNVDYATQDNAPLANGGTGKAKWEGWAGYANYQFSDQWRLSLRGEYFNDKDGYRTGVVQKWKEATLTLGYSPIKSLDIRAEVREDRSDVASFQNSAGTSASKNQHSYGLQAIYKF